MEARDAGRYLAQFGYPDAVRRGQATLSGQFDWQGAPRRSTIQSLSGRFDIEASDGQFNKLEPGSAACWACSACSRCRAG